MSVEYYAFALFLAGLICVVAIICKLLFADVKRQRKLLDEKETKLLKLFHTVEGIMEEFSDQVKTATEEMKEYESRAAQSVAALFTPQKPSKPSKSSKANASRASAKPAESDGNEFEELFSPQKPEAPETAKADSSRVDSSRMRAAGEALERAEKLVLGAAPTKSLEAPAYSGGKAVFQRIIDETVSDEPEPEPEEEISSKHARTNSILELAEEGKTTAQIARKLGITQNEVKLIIGLRARVEG